MLTYLNETFTNITLKHFWKYVGDVSVKPVGMFICRQYILYVGGCLHKQYFPCSRAETSMWRVSDKWWEFPPWEFHLGVTGGDDWKDTRTPNDLRTLIVFFLIHYTPIPTMGSTCSAYTPSNAKAETRVLNLWHVCPQRRAQNKHNSCKCIWSLLQALLCV